MKVIRIQASEGMRKAIGLIKAAGKRGVTIPGLATKMKLPQSSVDNYVRRLEAFGAVRKTQGKMPKDGTGRPPMVWAWAGRSVDVVELTVIPEATKPAAKSKRKGKTKRKGSKPRKATKARKPRKTKTRTKRAARKTPPAAPATPAV